MPETPEQPLPVKSFDSRTFRDHPVSFVRRSGRMTPSQERAWADLGPRFLLELPRGHAATSVADEVRVDPAEVFGRTALFFEGRADAELAPLGELRTPTIADLFVAKMQGATP